jgi:hypothetical protein
MADIQVDLSRPLREATVQEIQLELIRRTRFNAFDGEGVVRSLLRHRELWESVILGRIPVPFPGHLPASGLIPLRDLRHNLWNADTLYVLCPDKTAAEHLAAVAEKEEWGGEAHVFSDPKDVDRALGSGRETRAILRVWWD